MRFRNTFIALVVLLILGGYAFVTFFFTHTELAKGALDIKAEDIAKIDLKYPDRELIIERKPGAPWMITKPVGAKADQTTANNLARAISECQIEKTVEPHAQELAPFGLAKPQVTVTVTTTKGKRLEGLEVGKLTPVGFSAYLKFTDKPAVMLTSSAFPSGMNKTLEQMRDRELMEFKVDDVNRITIDHDNGPQVEIDRAGDKWKIVKPAQYAADPTQVRQILSTLSDLKVADFITDTPTDAVRYGLEKPHITVTVFTGTKGTPESLLFGFKQKESGKDGVYVRRGERAPIYTVHQYVMSAVDKTLLELRDKTVLSFDPSSVQAVNLDSNGKKFNLKRVAGGKWELVENGTTQPADVALVERFLDQIRDLKGNSIIMDPLKSPEMFGMDRPALIVSLLDKDGKQVGQLRLSRIEVKPSLAEGETASPASGTRTDYYAASSATTALFRTDDFMFSELNKSADQFRSRTAGAAATATPKK